MLFQDRDRVRNMITACRKLTQNSVPDSRTCELNIIPEKASEKDAGNDAVVATKTPLEIELVNIVQIRAT